MSREFLSGGCGIALPRGYVELDDHALLHCLFMRLRCLCARSGISLRGEVSLYVALSLGAAALSLRAGGLPLRERGVALPGRARIA